MHICRYTAADEANGEYSTINITLHRLHKQMVWVPCGKDTMIFYVFQFKVSKDTLIKLWTLTLT